MPYCDNKMWIVGGVVRTVGRSGANLRGLLNALAQFIPATLLTDRARPDGPTPLAAGRARQSPTSLGLASGRNSVSGSEFEGNAPISSASPVVLRTRLPGQRAAVRPARLVCAGKPPWSLC